jgi:hypothetical protein
MKHTGCCFKTSEDQIVSADVDEWSGMARTRVPRGRDRRRASVVSGTAGE